MANKLSVFVSNKDTAVQNMFVRMGHKVIHSFEHGFDILCLSGGVDVSPFLYGQRALPSVFSNFNRDLEEIRMWKDLAPDFPKVGICRGAQLGNVLCGGTLWQNVGGHSGNTVHMAKAMDLDSKPFTVVKVNSEHHQMARVTNQAKVLVSACRAEFKEDEKERVERSFGVWSDIEGFYYKNFNFLGIQWHPEWVKEKEESFTVFENYFNRFIEEKL